MENKIPFGLKNNKLVDIDEVDSGRNCNCICPNCKQPLIAAKGDKNIHHFKHDKDDLDKHCFESVLHITAKDIFYKYSNTVLPPVSLHGKNEFGHPVKFLGKQEIEYKKVELEKPFENIIPDIKLTTNDDKEYFVEIAVTHKVTYKKYQSLKTGNISTMEIYLGDLYKSLKENKQNLTIELLENFIVNDVNNRYWIFNKELNDFYEFMKSNYCEIKTTNEIIYKDPLVSNKTVESAMIFMDVLYSEWFYVDNCPIQKAQFQNGIKKGQYYANVEKDCRKCMYCVDIEYNFRTNDKKRSGYNAPEKIYCIYQPNHLYKNLIRDFTNRITTIHGNKKIEIKQRQNEQKNLYNNLMSKTKNKELTNPNNNKQLNLFD